VKYTPENGCIAVNVLADGKDLVVSVRDNGLGISGALLPHIFDLFAQSSRTIAASAGGLGVGLAVVKAVAESHGGTVSATSAGPASEFTLRLPIVLERPMAAASQQTTPSLAVDTPVSTDPLSHDRWPLQRAATRHRARANYNLNGFSQGRHPRRSVCCFHATAADA
jgi:hypothetical protein